MAEKQCTKCGVPMPLEEFPVAKHHSDGRASQCKQCTADRESVYRKAARYGVTVERFAEMRAAQNDRCAICNSPETFQYAGRSHLLSIDHSHATGKIRGLLCRKHNAMLGLANDSIETLRAAIAYLEKHGE